MSTAAVWLIWSNTRSAWWRSFGAGYCTDARDAGLFTKEETDEHCSQPRDVAIHVDDAYRQDPLLSEEHHANQLAAALQAYVDALYDGPSNLGGLTNDALEQDALNLLTVHTARRAAWAQCPKSPKGA